MNTFQLPPTSSNGQDAKLATPQLTDAEKQQQLQTGITSVTGIVPTLQ